MSKKKATAISLPISRTARIMASAQGVEKVNPDIVALATKATEIFLMDFAKRAYDQSSDEEFRSNVLEYDDLQKLVHRDPRYDFLTDTYPKRIKFSEALNLLRQHNGEEIQVKNGEDGGDTVKDEGQKNHENHQDYEDSHHSQHSHQSNDDKLDNGETQQNNQDLSSDNDHQISRDEDSEDQDDSQHPDENGDQEND